MSFQPVVTLTKVPRDNSYFVLTDATPIGGANGWGSTNAPADPTTITSIFGQLQAYGESPIDISGVAGNVVSTMTFSTTIADGVNNFYAYYGLEIALSDFSISNDGITITSNDPNLSNKLDSVTAINLDGAIQPALIESIVGNKITLSSSLSANVVGTSLFIYYRATIQALTVNNGESIIVNAISLVPLEADKCVQSQAILDLILLKLGAQIAFGCSNISKAHEAARLLGGNKPFVTNNCSTCG